MPETSDQGAVDATTSMGVSVGDGMIHYVLMTQDHTGRTTVDSRVFDVDPDDGLDSVGRVNAGIDLMMDAARSAHLRVGTIGVAARSATSRRRLRSGGSGTRRQVHLSSDEESVAEYLSQTGLIDRYGSVVVADCGDTGMSLYTVDPATGRIASIERTTRISGRELDESLADRVAAAALPFDADSRTRRGRELLVSGCRTAKEETGSSGGPTTSGLVLTAEAVAAAAQPMIESAREAFSRYVSALTDRGRAPDAVVFVGGLANLPTIQEIAADGDLPTLVAPTPELAAATGAAMLSSGRGTSRLGFIGGHRARRWSAVPVAVGVGVFAAVVMAAVAVGAALTGGTPVSPKTTPTSSALDTPIVASDDSLVSGSLRSRQVETTPSAPASSHAPLLPQTPRWVTTELPPTVVSPTTLTLVPPQTTSPSPSESATPSTSPTLPIPPEWLPPGFPTTLPPHTGSPAPQPTRPQSSTPVPEVSPELTGYPIVPPRSSAVPTGVTPQGSELPPGSDTQPHSGAPRNDDGTPVPTSPPVS